MRKALPFLLLAVPAPVSAAQSVAVASTSGGRHSHSSVMVTVRLGKTARINDLAIRPVAVLEDSRCPAEVQCAWAGNLRLNVAIAGKPNMVLELGRPVEVAGGRLTLLGAEPRRTKKAVPPPGAYVFTIRYEKP